MQVVLSTFKIGRVEEGKFRFCGLEYVQHSDFSIEVNARENTRAIKPLSLPKAKAPEPVTNAQRTALRSVVGSLAWVARAARPDPAYRVNALQTQICKATVETLREANRVVELALKDGDRAILFKGGLLPWQAGELAVVTFSDASFAAEAGYKSQRGRIHYLTVANIAREAEAMTHPAHFISYGSSTMKRVCRATLQCEAYSLQHATEHADRIRAALLELLGRLPRLRNWDDYARRSLFHLQLSDCRSLTDHLLSSIPRAVEDKRLAIEMAALRQSLWTDEEERTCIADAPHGDELRWVPTHLQLADALTKSLKPLLLNQALETGSVIVREQ